MNEWMKEWSFVQTAMGKFAAFCRDIPVYGLITIDKGIKYPFRTRGVEIYVIWFVTVKH